MRISEIAVRYSLCSFIGMNPHLPRSRFTRNQDRLILSSKGESFVRERRDFVNVRFHTIARIVVAGLPDNTVRIIRALFLSVEFSEPLEWVDGNNNITSTRIRFSVDMAFLHVVQNGCL